MNENSASEAFSAQAPIFDELYQHNTIVQHKRDSVRSHVAQFIQPGSYILELNAGTGEDAIYFAKQGHTVHATDISEGMQRVAKEKITRLSLENKIKYDLCSFTELQSLQNPEDNISPQLSCSTQIQSFQHTGDKSSSQLPSSNQIQSLQHTGDISSSQSSSSIDLLSNQNPERYDYIFSNFAGLNCTEQIDKVLSSFDSLLKPGGCVTMVIMPGFCLWETLLIFKGKFKTATRRLFAGKGTKAHIEGCYFTCTYYSASTIKRYMKKRFDLIGHEGLCTIVPPSYMEHFGEKHPRLFEWLKKKELKYKSGWPWRSVGDYYIISFRKK